MVSASPKPTRTAAHPPAPANASASDLAAAMSRSSSDDPAGAVPTSNASPPPDSYSTTTVEPSASSRVERYLRSLGGSSSSSAGSSSSQPQKKWVPEQGHWETDYGQVWVPNVVYTRHERWMCSVCHATFNSAAEMDNHVISTYGDAQHPNGASAINDSYTTSEDQGHYEQKATGQHWVVDVAGHWE